MKKIQKHNLVKNQKGRLKGLCLKKKKKNLFFGILGLQAKNKIYMNTFQIEALRKELIYYVRGYGKIWIRIKPTKSFSKKPEKTRMGKGKGNHYLYCAPVKPGQIIIEVSTNFTLLNIKNVINALIQASKKLNVQVTVKYRNVLKLIYNLQLLS